MLDYDSMEKRKRSCNFSESDKKLLLQLISQKYDVVESKKSDNHTIREKQQAWESIKEAYNVLAHEPRTVVQLRNLYGNIKKRNKTIFLKGKIEPFDMDDSYGFDEPEAVTLITAKPNSIKNLQEYITEESIDHIKYNSDDQQPQHSLQQDDESLHDPLQIPISIPILSGTANLQNHRETKQEVVSDSDEVPDRVHRSPRNTKTVSKEYVEMQILFYKRKREQRLMEISELTKRQEEEILKQQEEKTRQEKIKTEMLLLDLEAKKRCRLG